VSKSGEIVSFGLVTGYSATAMVIPAFQPSSRLLELLEELTPLLYGHLILVDDGSGSNYDEIFETARSLGCVVLTHAVNQGKGRALKTAFEYCLAPEHGILDVITADSDGQHLVEDIVAVTDRAIANRAEHISATVLGTRDFSSRTVPFRSRFGNRFTSGLVRVLFGRYLADTQTGLRALPVEQLTDLSEVRGERFEYEMNVLLRLLTTQELVQEQPTSTVYHDIENSQSHFRPVRDSIQIYVQIFFFTWSSLLGSLVDLGLYAAIVNLAFEGRDDPFGIVLAVVIARIVSASVNFTVNRQLVFRSGSFLKGTIVRYFVLAIGLLAVSAGGSVVLAHLFQGHVVWAKAIVDTLLFAVSYIVQKRWVFRSGTSV